jgi:hypothetical protein
MCGAAWAASQTKIAPCSCAHATSRSTGDRAERVRDEVGGDDYVPPRASSLRPEVELSVVVQRHHAELGAALAADVLPGTKLEDVEPG